MEISLSNCPSCKKPYNGFKDNESMAEYKQSGLCQNCQDEFFGAPTLPKGNPTGICRDCGRMTYQEEEFCSQSCETDYMNYLNEGLK